jgi:hypothetical protein
MAKPGLKAWRAMPKARRQNLKAKGVDTRREKAQFGRKLVRSRKQGTPGPTAKGVADKGGPGQRRRRGQGAADAAALAESASGGVAPRGARVERTRKTTTAGGKVGVTRTGVTSGGPGPEAYRQVAPAAAGGGTSRRRVGKKAKALGRKPLLGRKRGGIAKPGKGGPGKRLIAKGGGGRAALQTWRGLPGPQRQRMLQKARQAEGSTAQRLVQQVRRATPVQAKPKQAPKKRR